MFVIFGTDSQLGMKIEGNDQLSWGLGTLLALGVSVCPKLKNANSQPWLA